ncbi:hypothetical protein [Sphingomonas qomolangmaensis]|uniref:Uncharacterized protein n=1 Tax=Sphingomonas qomolangmaensis TaxID=2918765 RepID=A0ABY5L7H8_9SPHN|nr:hypothetical protein [Sphingomonas qomolangmaensis]UUL82752.1 hypothetical protein NMP03_00445 [Sphingomonas qomolangmaensis]
MRRIFKGWGEGERRKDDAGGKLEHAAMGTRSAAFDTEINPGRGDYTFVASDKAFASRPTRR